MNNGNILHLLSACIVAVLNGAAWEQCEVTQLASQGGFGPVSIDGDVAVIGDTDAFGSLGAAYVYHRGPGGPEDWKIEAVLMAPEPDVEDVFGSSVAVSGDVIVLGAPGADTPEFQSGAAHVFRYDPLALRWVHDTTLTASDGDGNDVFGASVAIDSDVVLVGAPEDENESLDRSGSAYVFRYDRETSRWDEEAKLTDPNAEEEDLFGVSVSIRGDVALVGAHGNNHVWNFSGSAFVFRREGSKWSFEQELADFDDPLVEWFGFSVSLADGVAIVGAFGDNSTPKGNDAGSAYIYRFDPDTSGWIEEQKITASDAAPLDWFGRSVSINADPGATLVGAQNDDDLGSKSGSAYVFRYTPDTPPPWQETIKLLAFDGEPFDRLGRSVSMSQDIALIKGGGKGYVFAGLQGIDCNDNKEPDACDIFDGESNDLNTNGVPDECDADLDGSGSVGVGDLLILLANWGPCEECKIPGECPADLDGDCTVGVVDLLILLDNWG